MSANRLRERNTMQCRRHVMSIAHCVYLIDEIRLFLEISGRSNVLALQSSISWPELEFMPGFSPWIECSGDRDLIILGNRVRNKLLLSTNPS